MTVQTPSIALGALTRVADLWFDDPNAFVIKAGASLYRVNIDELTSKSSVFHDMKEVGRANDSEYLDGCPLICLPDPECDVTCFFRAIFIPTYFRPPPAPTDFETVLAVLRLGYKYDVACIRQCALEHLATAYSTTLAGWSRRSDTRTFPPTLKFDDEFQLLQAVIKMDARWAMPALFYSCCAYPMKEILHSARWIDAGDLLEKRKCLLGYVEQFAATSRVLRFLVQPPSSECISRERCYESRLTWFDMVDAWRASIPLDIWDEGDWKRFSKDVCASCIAQSRIAHRRARQAVWDDLPKTFGLPSWEVLEASKLSALG